MSSKIKTIMSSKVKTISDLDKNGTGTIKVYNDLGQFLWISYWVNDKLHREDGPAVIFYDNYSKEYWLNGQCVTAEEVWDQMTDEQKTQEIFNLNEWQ